jgi:mannitol/fructose-specific phosphotransferase system IIA component (Ntr-type)
MIISDYIGNVFFDITASEKMACILEMSDKLRKSTGISASFSKKIIEREIAKPSGLRHGIAFPRAFNADVPCLLGGVAILKRGIDWGQKDPARIVFMVVASQKYFRLYLKLVMSVGKLLSSAKARDSILNATSPEEVIEQLNVSYL